MALVKGDGEVMGGITSCWRYQYRTDGSIGTNNDKKNVGHFKEGV